MTLWTAGESRWEHFPHRADVGVRGIGPTPAAAFAQAARAMTAAITGPEHVVPREQVTIELEGSTPRSLPSNVPSASKTKRTSPCSHSPTSSCSGSSGHRSRGSRQKRAPSSSRCRRRWAAFPHGASSIPASPRDRHDALGRIIAALEQHAGADPNGELRATAEEANRALEQANDSAKKEQSERKAAHEALEQARHDWDEAYLATKEIVSGLLRAAGRREELPRYFPDLGG